MVIPGYMRDRSRLALIRRALKGQTKQSLFRFAHISGVAGDYSGCLFSASNGLSGVSQPSPCEMVKRCLGPRGAVSMPGHQASGYCRAGTSPKCASGDTAKLPHGSGPKEIDAIEQHHVEVGTT